MQFASYDNSAVPSGNLRRLGRVKFLGKILPPNAQSDYIITQSMLLAKSVEFKLTLFKLAVDDNRGMQNYRLEESVYFRGGKPRLAPILSEEVLPMLPWETPELVLENLKVIASLKRGDKLSVLKEGQGDVNLVGNRGLRERFKKSSSWITRSKKGESITNENLYLIPLRTLFTEACRLYHDVDYVPEHADTIGHSLAQTRDSRHQVSRREIHAALDGLRQLKATYDKQYSSRSKRDHQAHRDAAQRIVDEVSRVVHAMEIQPNANLRSLVNAKEWLKSVPSEFRADVTVRRIAFMLDAYEQNIVLFQRPEDKSYRKVFLRFDLYLISKIWLDRHQNVRLGGGRSQRHLDKLYRKVHEVYTFAEELLCRSLRCNPDELPRTIKACFGRKVEDGLLREDWKQVNETQTLKYLDRVQLQKYRLVFESGLVKRYPYNRPDLDPDEHNGRLELELADTRNGVGEAFFLDQGQIVRHQAAGFVLGHDRHFYMTGHMAEGMADDLGGKGFKHSSYFSADNVLFAGVITIENGNIKTVDTGSGHYKPGKLQLLHCLQALVANGVRLDEVRVTGPSIGDRNALEFLRNFGRGLH